MSELKDADVFLALGSNLGDRLGNLELAMFKLGSQLKIDRCSSVYETPPWGYTDQPTFFNQVLFATTTLTPIELLFFAKETEQNMGRIKNFRNGPRVIDIDILIYGEEVFQTSELTLPHPHMLERGFVLVPLAEIIPDLVIPGTGFTVSHFLAQVDCSGIQKLCPTRK